jgi:hypothetical protein
MLCQQGTGRQSMASSGATDCPARQARIRGVACTLAATSIPDKWIKVCEWLMSADTESGAALVWFTEPGCLQQQAD